MPKRTRAYDAGRQDGMIIHTDGSIAYSTAWRERHSCVDDYRNGPEEGHDLFIEHYNAQGGLLHTHGAHDGSWNTFVTKPSYALGMQYDKGHYHTNAPGDDYAATVIMGKSNPNTPDVDLPVSIAELRDLPNTVRLAGNTILKKVGSANLAYQFGFKPLVSDFEKLFQFESLVEKRIQMLKSLSKGVVVRKAEVGTYTNYHEFWSNEDQNLGWRRMRRDMKERVWGYAVWGPDVALPTSDSALRNLAIRQVLGLKADYATFWNMLPWSWLVDWFSNIGDYLDAHRNLVPCSPKTGIKIHRHKVSKIYNIDPKPWDHAVRTWDSYSDRVVEYETKHRNTRSMPTVNAHLPFLDGRQLSILSSLAVLRMR